MGGDAELSMIYKGGMQIDFFIKRNIIKHISISLFPKNVIKTSEISLSYTHTNVKVLKKP